MSSIDSNSSNNFYSLSSSDESCNDDSFHSTSDHPLNITLNSCFSDSQKSFNIIHINAQSIPAHYPDMLASFESRNIHAILISESWLKPCLSSTSYALPGFHLIRNDRIDKAGGGVAIYLRSHIPFHIVSTSTQPPTDDAAEHLMIEVILSHTKILVGVFYNPPSILNYFKSFEIILESFTSLYSHSIIMGDFNTCLNKDDYRRKKLLSLIESCNLHILPLSDTHYFPGCTPSLLDLIMVSSPNSVIKHGQYSADAFSYHDLIYLSYNTRPPKAKPNVLLRRSFGGIDKERLFEDARKIDWSAIANSDSIDLKVELLNQTLTHLYDVHAPLKPVKIKHLPAPWLTEELRNLMEKKNCAKYKFKLNNNDVNKNNYIKTRNRCNTSCRDAQRRHIHKSIEHGDTAKTWKFLETLGVGKSNSSNTPSIDIDVEFLNKHFSSSQVIDNVEKERTLNILSSLPTPDFLPFTFCSFTECDVKENVLSISSNAVGADCVSRNMIIPILDIISPILTHILNYSITTSTFPESWKHAQIIPLPKKVKPLNVNDFRPISILPFLSKTLEKLIHKQLSIFLNKHLLLSPFQSGFRPGVLYYDSYSTCQSNG